MFAALFLDERELKFNLEFVALVYVFFFFLLVYNFRIVEYQCKNPFDSVKTS